MAWNPIGRTGARPPGLAQDHACSSNQREIRLYTNVAITETLSYCARHGYMETHQVFSANPSGDYPVRGK